MNNELKYLKTLEPDVQFTDPYKFRQNYHFDEFVPFLETEKGIKYINKIKSILKKANKPLCIRDIHTLLGKSAIPQYTLDALSSLHAEEHQSGDMRRFTSEIKR